MGSQTSPISFVRFFVLLVLSSYFSSFCNAQFEANFEPSFDGTLNHLQYQPYIEPETPRFAAQKQRMLEQIQKPEVYNEETWTEDHPRYGLLWALHGLYRYRERHMTTVDDWQALYDKVPDKHKKIVRSKTKYEHNFATIRALFDKNSDVAEDMLRYAMIYYNIPLDELREFVEVSESNDQWDNQYRSEEALYHYMRDWSTDGFHEREIPYDFIFKELEKHFPDREGRKEGPVNVLVPGSGLGRLAHEISALGNFEVTACEYSPQMRIAYRYLEQMQSQKSTVYPYIDWWSHQPTTKELVHPVEYPDISMNASNVLLVEGDFTKEFVNQTAHYDAIVTFFFIDTAKNVLDYFDTMSQVLKPGGVWINLGPLLYYEAHVEFALDDLLNIASEYGFEFLDVDEEWGPLTLKEHKARSRQIGYLFNERSLRRNTYMAQFWAAKKKASIKPE